MAGISILLGTAACGTLINDCATGRVDAYEAVVHTIGAIWERRSGDRFRPKLAVCGIVDQTAKADNRPSRPVEMLRPGRRSMPSAGAG